MLHESRASDTVINDSVAEIPRFLNVYTCANNNIAFSVQRIKHERIGFVIDFPNPVGRLTKTLQITLRF